MTQLLERPQPAPLNEDRIVLPDSRELPRKLWTRDEYRRLIADGFLLEGKNELIEGEIIPKMSQGRRHIISVTRIIKMLAGVFGPDVLQTQANLYVGTAHDPEPDLTVLKKNVAEYVDDDPGPQDVHLVAEISDSTLRLDITTKAAVYARAGIVEYWVVNVNARTLHIFREPTSEGYTSETILGETEAVPPLAASEAVISVADLLP